MDSGCIVLVVRQQGKEREREPHKAKIQAPVPSKLQRLQRSYPHKVDVQVADPTARSSVEKDQPNQTKGTP